MRISDWSSDVCSSDLRSRRAVSPIDKARRFEDRRGDPLGKPPAIGCKGIGVVKIQQKCVLRHNATGRFSASKENQLKLYNVARARVSVTSTKWQFVMTCRVRSEERLAGKKCVVRVV